MEKDPNDPTGVIREAYRIEGIRPEECRSIFMDWALQRPVDAPPQPAIRALLARYGAPEHPMTEVLRAGLAPAHAPRRRGGAGTRRS